MSKETPQSPQPLTERQRELGPCSMCGEPYHRYAPQDPEHDYDPMGCINSLSYALEQARSTIDTQAQEIATLRGALEWIVSDDATGSGWRELREVARAALSPQEGTD